MLQIEGIADANTQRLNSRRMLGMLSEGEKCGRFKVCRHCRGLVDLGLYGLSHKELSFYFERHGESSENCEQRRSMICFSCFKESLWLLWENRQRGLGYERECSLGNQGISGERLA